MSKVGWLLFFLALLPAFAVHLVTYTPSEPFFNGDETRHLTTGVFFRDFFLSAEWLHPKRYATDYYLQYPALGLPVWPPGLHVSEGIWFLVFGDSFASARALVFVYFLFASFNLHRLARRTHGTITAMLATALFALMPIVVQFSTRVMAEIPCLAWVLGLRFPLRTLPRRGKTHGRLARLPLRRLRRADSLRRHRTASVSRRQIVDDRQFQGIETPSGAQRRRPRTVADRAVLCHYL